ncbi:MAG: hypothetical protein FWF12_10880 [Betaproteobacteria bacterium]|nr:hypothetical protein [Betaproteobacteria bacterium]
MKQRIASLTAMLLIGLISSTSALAGPNDHYRGHAAYNPPRHSAPPARHYHYAHPPRQVVVVRHAPQPRTVVYHHVPAPQYYVAPPPQPTVHIGASNILTLAVGTGLVVHALHHMSH